MGRDVFLSFPLTLVPRLFLCHIKALSCSLSLFFFFTPPNPLCCSMVWWQHASLLGRWDSNQSGLPRGASDRRARLPNCPQAGRQAGRLSRCNTCSQRDRCRRASWPPQRVNHFLGQMDGPHYKGHMDRPVDVTGKCSFLYMSWCVLLVKPAHELLLHKVTELSKWISQNKKYLLNFNKPRRSFNTTNSCSEGISSTLKDFLNHLDEKKPLHRLHEKMIY